MKRRAAVLFLSCIMAFTNTASVSAAFDAAPEMQTENAPEADLFSEPDGEVLFSDDEEEAFFDTATEDAALFSGEEVPLIDGEVTVHAAGAGFEANPSVYREGESSFGRQKRLDALGSRGNFPWSYDDYNGNYGRTIHDYYYHDADGNLHIVTVDIAEKILYDAVCNSRMEITGQMKVPLPLPIWGGFYAAPDGNFYVAVGQSNLEESPDKIVAKILKYSSSWKYLGCADVPGSTGNVYPGIVEPFAFSSLRMTMVGNLLVIRTGRIMFALEGINHQSCISFFINTDTMQMVASKQPYTSHSLNQFVVSDGSALYYLDQGDAFDRGLNIAKYMLGETNRDGIWRINLPFQGEIGDNYTGSQITGFVLEGDTLITVGKSVPHSYGLEGVTGYEDSLNRNVFMVFTNKNTGKSEFSWVTKYNPKGKKVIVEEPRLIKLAPNQYVLLYSEGKGTDSVLHYLLMDGRGNVSLSKEYKGVTLQTDSQPIVSGSSIYWISGNYDAKKTDYETWLYKIPIVTVPLEKISLKETSVSVKEGDKKALSLNYYPQNTNDVKDVQWTSSNSTIAAVNSSGVVTGRNYGTATITAVCGSYKVSCKVSVKIPNSDEPLPAPKVKLSQKRADKIHLSWNRITGAKGYQVFYKTTKNGSYKKIASVKNTELSYDLASKPGTTYYVKVRAHGTNTKGKTKYSPSSAARSLKAIVPVPANVNFALAKDGGYITWDKLEGASGYVVYRYDSVAKTLKPNQTVWRDPKSMVSEGKYKLYEYHVKAFLTVNGKKIYSKPSKTVSLFA